ncbi:hypothetical protein HK103_002258 [Boothiomyces macroporosus]|uniref:Uncharacterized protein n=1 Tax=Boothiomyces macroporosus TaxID=261099 RepID=A0AAD5U9H4_9FUNG|nr:hypothetical protein HK103_002258 [Boothiomyces macroporosus]
MQKLISCQDQIQCADEKDGIILVSTKSELRIYEDNKLKTFFKTGQEALQVKIHDYYYALFSDKLVKYDNSTYTTAFNIQANAFDIDTFTGFITDTSIQIYDEELILEYPIKYRGVAIKFNPNKPDQFIYGLVNGTIQIMNINMEIVHSIYYPGILYSLDWNAGLIGVIIDQKWLIYDYKQNTPIHSDNINGSLFKFNKNRSGMFCILSPNKLYLYSSGYTRVPNTFNVKNSKFLTWENELKVCHTRFVSLVQ